MTKIRLTKHQKLTDKTIEEHAKNIYDFLMLLENRMVNELDTEKVTAEPKALVNLLIKCRNFGVRGQLNENDMLINGFDMIKIYSSLEDLYLSSTYLSTNPIGTAIIQTIMLGCEARLELASSEGVDLTTLYNSSNATFPIEGRIELNALAVLADMSLQSVRNHMSKSETGFSTQQEDGKYYVPVNETKVWLKERNSFKPTMRHSPEKKIEDEDELLVPIARDGTYFNTGCRMKKGYRVGDKGDERSYSDFDSALDYLMSMTIAKWRRPNTSGNWGMVKAAEWRRIPKSEVH